MGSEDSHLQDSIVAFRAVNIMDVTMVVTDEANAKSEAPVKVIWLNSCSFLGTVWELDMKNRAFTFTNESASEVRRVEFGEEVFKFLNALEFMNFFVTLTRQ